MMFPEADPFTVKIEESKEVSADLPSKEEANPGDELRLSQRTAAFTALTEDIPAAVNPSLFWEEVITRVAKDTGADVALLFGCSEDPQQWFLLASFGMPASLGKGGPLSRAWQSLPTIISKEESSLFSDDIAKDRRFVGQMIRGTTVRTFLGTTLKTDTACLGSLCVGFNASDAQTEADRAFFIDLSKSLSLSFATLQVSQPGLFVPTEGSERPVQIVAGENIAKKPEQADSMRRNNPVPSTVVTESAPDGGSERSAPANVVTPVGSSKNSANLFENTDPVKRDVVSLPPATSGDTQGGEIDRPVSAGVVTPVSTPVVIPVGGSKNSANLPASAANSTRRSDASLPTAPVAPASPVAPLAINDVKTKVLEALFASLTSVFHGEDFSKEILKKIVAIMEADIGYLLRWDQGNQRLFPVASEGVLPEIAKRMERSGIKPDPIWGKIIDRNQPLLLTFENWKSPLKKRLCGEESFRSQITVSVRHGNETWGLLSLFHRTNVYTQRELKLLESVGEKIGLAFEAATQWESLHRTITTLTLAQSFGQIMTKGIADLSSLLDGIKKATGVSNVYLLLCDTTRNIISGCAASGPSPTLIHEVEIRMEENTICPLTVKQSHPLVIENAPSDPRVDKKWFDLFRSRSLFSIPLIVQGRVMGVLLLDETAYFRRFTEEEIQTAVALSHSAAFSIEAALQYQEALEQRERQENLSLTILRISEEERRHMAETIGQGTVEILEKTRKRIAESLLSLPAGSKSPLDENGLILKKSIEEMKAFSSDLYPDLLEKQGLLAMLRGYTETFSKSTGVLVQLKAPSSLKRSSVGFELLLYRIAQEAFCNVSKHASAKVVLFSIDRKEAHWQMSITDDGKGFDARRYFASPPVKRKGMGILCMKGRVEIMGGTFYIESEPQRGTRVSIKIPVTKKEIL